MRTLFTQRGVVTMPRTYNSVVSIDAEQLAADVTDEFLEPVGFRGLANPAREQAVPSKKLHGCAITGRRGLGAATGVGAHLVLIATEDHRLDADIGR